MAKKTASKKDATPEEKLRALYDLQLIDSKIDNIRTVRGELPLEVQDLEDEIEGLETRLNNHKEEIKALEDSVAERKNGIAEAKTMIKKYNDQQSAVRNNREFDSLTKEIEYQNLEIQLCEKKIKEHGLTIVNKNEMMQDSVSSLDERKKDLEDKKKELDEIIEETKREEELLIKESEKAQKVVDDRLLGAYQRIRNASKNGLAVVPIDREASGGSFIKIPPQKQLDIAARKKIIVDEHSGRILVDKELAEEQIAKINSKIEKLLK